MTRKRILALSLLLPLMVISSAASADGARRPAGRVRSFTDSSVVFEPGTNGRP
jgi:hypothetical protein